MSPALPVASGTVLIRPDPAAAALNELAEVAATQKTPVTSPITYSRVTAKRLVTREIPGTADNEFSYVLASVSERWMTIDGTQTVAVHTYQPTFPDPRSERIHEEVDQGISDGVGSTRQFTLTEVQHPAVVDSWPTDPHELTSFVKSLPGVHSELDAIDQLLDVARSSVVDPTRKSAAFRALANLGLERIQTADFPYLFRHRGRDAGSLDRIEFLEATGDRPADDCQGDAGEGEKHQRNAGGGD